MHTNIRYPEDDYQCTITDQWCGQTWVRNIRGRRVVVAKQWHYRIVLGTVGYDLRHLESTGELLRATYDVFQGT